MRHSAVFPLLAVLASISHTLANPLPVPPDDVLEAMSITRFARASGLPRPEVQMIHRDSLTHAPLGVRDEVRPPADKGIVDEMEGQRKRSSEPVDGDGAGAGADGTQYGGHGTPKRGVLTAREEDAVQERDFDGMVKKPSRPQPQRTPSVSPASVTAHPVARAAVTEEVGVHRIEGRQEEDHPGGRAGGHGAPRERGNDGFVGVEH